MMKVERIPKDDSEAKRAIGVLLTRPVGVLFAWRWIVVLWGEW